MGGPAFSNLTLVSQTFTLGLTFGLTAGTITINWAGTNQSNDFTAVFNVGVAAAAVPEPGTWAMMIFGFGAVGYSLRSRKVGYKALQTV